MASIVLLLLDLFIVAVSVITFCLCYVCLRWIHLDEIAAVLMSMFWSCYPIAITALRQGSSGFQPINKETTCSHSW